MNYLLNDISRNRLTIPVTSLLAVIFAFVSSFFMQQGFDNQQPDNVLWGIVSQWNLTPVAAHYLNLAIGIVTAWSIFKMNEHFSLSHFRSTLPFLFYVLLFLGNPMLQFPSEGTFSAIFITGAIFLLFTAYQQERSASYGFITGVLLGTLSLFWTKGLFYVPIFIIGLWFMRCLTLRSLLAILLGGIGIFWLQFADYFWTEKTPLFFDQFKELSRLGMPDLSRIPIFVQSNFLLTLLLGIISGTKLLISNLQEKVRTQACYNFIILLSISATLLSFFDFANISGHLTIMYLTVAILVADFFTTLETKSATYLFFLIPLLYLGLYCMNIWVF